MSSHNPVSERDALNPPSRGGRDGYPSFGGANTGLRPLASSFAPSMGQPGSFNPALKAPSNIVSQSYAGRPELGSFVPIRPPRTADVDDTGSTERRQADLSEQIEKEKMIKIGSENLLEALSLKNPKQSREQRMRVESELNNSNQKIAQLKQDLAAEIERSKQPSPSRLSQLFKAAPARSPSPNELENPFDLETESPTFVLSELLQSLEAEGYPSEYYVERANSLVELFQRHPTLKYDLAWSIFGLRMQILLLSDSREVVAASFRVLRHVITDRKSLSIIRALHTDYLVVLSLVKESKASVEREQALKFVRAFLDVKDGTSEISKAIVRVIAAVAQHAEDRIRSICILTLAEILVRDPTLVIDAGGMTVLVEAFAERSFQCPEGLTHAFLYLTDTPLRRKFLKSGYELEGPFAAFTDGNTERSEDELKISAKAISALLKSWSGLATLSRENFFSLKSLMLSMQIPSAQSRDVILDLVFDVLRIKPPSWSSSFFAGRRLTTYGRVAYVRNDVVSAKDFASRRRDDLVDHFTAAILVAFLRSGLLDSIQYTIQNEAEPSVKRKATLLLGEVLNLANDLLPTSWSLKMQVLPSLFQSASVIGTEDRHIASSAIYQIESVNRTLHRTNQSSSGLLIEKPSTGATSPRQGTDPTRNELTPQIDEAVFRAVITDTQVLSTVNFAKWRWDLIQKIIEGPLLNPKRLEEALKANKFVKRIMGFYRPFKYRFSEIRNTKPNQRYVRVGCSLIRTLLASNEGIKYLAEHKLLRQIAECLAQLDRLSGLTSTSPLFSIERISDTLTGGYFTLLGVLSSSLPGLMMMERWKMINMFYHIVELQGRDDLLKCLLVNMDFTLDSTLRIILSKALTSCSPEIRVFSTRLLRKYATRNMHALNAGNRESAYVEWAIELLVTQLYDPEVEVCEVAIKVLEEACNDEASLEFVVRCRPALDHLGEIGAPLLLRFLSTSTGYHYLDGLDYITQEMDDWFLGRNESYVTLVEASLAKALAESLNPSRQQPEEANDPQLYGSAPPHFYRELTRTKEGCRLLEEKGHFNEFVAIIRHHGLENEDPEIMLKAKGALWAVGNVGSMELGAPFLESTDAVELIINVAENSEVLSMRGTAFFVLGLMSRSIHGQEILAEHGWDSTVDDAGCSLGICIPNDFQTLFTMKSSRRLKEDENDQTITADPAAEEPFSDKDGGIPPSMSASATEDPQNARILSLVKDLGNTVLTKARANELRNIKAKKAPGFQQPQLFHKVMRVLEQHHFRLPALRFVFDLFDKRVLRHIVLDESDDDDEEGDGDRTLLAARAASPGVVVSR